MRRANGQRPLARIHEVLSHALEKRDKSVTARMWAYRSFELPINVFDFTVSRHRDGPDEMFDGYTGSLMADCLWGIDNNEVEQLMKQVALGRKNWLFLGSVDASRRAASFATTAELWDSLFGGRWRAGEPDVFPICLIGLTYLMGAGRLLLVAEVVISTYLKRPTRNHFGKGDRC